MNRIEQVDETEDVVMQPKAIASSSKQFTGSIKVRPYLLTAPGAFLEIQDVLPSAN